MKLQTQKIADYLKTQPVNRAWLFGSYATDTATDDSDIDILVELDHTKPIGLHFAQMILDLERITGKRVDLLTQKGLSKHIRPYIEKQKVMIYENE